MTVAVAGAIRRGRIPLGGRFIAVAVGLAPIPLLAANGGYYPTSWGWAAMIFAGAGAVAAAARVRPGPRFRSSCSSGG